LSRNPRKKKYSVKIRESHLAVPFSFYHLKKKHFKIVHTKSGTFFIILFTNK
jgi:hypothetical protein